MNKERIVLDVIAKGDAKGLKPLALGLDNLASKADHAGDSMKGFADRESKFRRGLGQLGNAADETGDSFDKMSRKSGHLGEEIRKTEEKIKRLIVQLDRSGDTSLLGDIGSEKSKLSKLKGLQRLFGDQGKDAGKGFMSGLMSAIGDMPLRSKAITAAIGIGAAMAPLLGAAIASAVTGAVGLGGIAGGIALAAKDPRVKYAATILGNAVSVDMAEIGKAFVGPTVNALEILRSTWLDIAPGLSSGLNSIARAVEPLAEGFGGFIRRMMPGLNKTLEESGQIIGVIADELPGLGDAIGDMFADFASGEGNVEGMRATLEGLSAILRGTGKTVNWLSDRWGEQVLFVNEVTDALGYVTRGNVLFGKGVSDTNDTTERWIGNNQKIAGSLNGIASGSRDAAGNIKGIARSAEEAIERLDLMKDTFDKLFDAQMSNRSSARQYQQAIDDMTDSIKENGRSLDIDSEAGRKNQDQIDDLVSSAKAMYDAEIKSGDGSEQAMIKAQQTYEARIGYIRRLLISLGLEKDTIDSIITELGDIPAITRSIVEIGVRYATATERTPGEHSGIRINELVSSKVKRPVTIPAPRSMADKRGFASGGYAPMTGMFTVGERGPEVMGTRNGKPYVMSNPQSRQFLGDGGGLQRLELAVMSTPRMGNDLADAILRNLTYQVRTGQAPGLVTALAKAVKV